MADITGLDPVHCTAFSKRYKTKRQATEIRDGGSEGGANYAV
jgi:hypothetical protein